MKLIEKWAYIYAHTRKAVINDNKSNKENNTKVANNKSDNNTEE